MRSKFTKFKFYHNHKVPGFILSLILLSSLTTFPIIVSINYWFEVYAEYFHLEKDGNYTSFKTNLPNELQALTVSAWVKPDYTGGSSEFTVISKENAFILGINKFLAPEKIAKFSIYDGIKWHTVESTSEIPERWTHLAATFDNLSINIYVNGKLESTLSDIEVMSVSERGELARAPLASISSDLDVILGAYITIKNNQLKAINQFPGLYNNIKVFDFVADSSQIEELYNEHFVVQEFSQGVILFSGSTTSIQPVQEFSDGVVIISSSTTGISSVQEFSDSVVIISSSTTSSNYIGYSKTSDNKDWFKEFTEEEDKEDEDREDEDREDEEVCEDKEEEDREDEDREDDKEKEDHSHNSYDSHDHKHDEKDKKKKEMKCKLRETITLTEVVDTTTAGLTQKLQETLALADDVAPSTGNFQKKLQETLAIADDVIPTAGLAQRLTETLALADELTLTTQNFQQLEETLALADDVTPTAEFTKKN